MLERFAAWRPPATPPAPFSRTSTGRSTLGLPRSSSVLACCSTPGRSGGRGSARGASAGSSMAQALGLRHRGRRRVADEANGASIYEEGRHRAHALLARLAAPSPGRPPLAQPKRWKGALSERRGRSLPAALVLLTAGRRATSCTGSARRTVAEELSVNDHEVHSHQRQHPRRGADHPRRDRAHRRRLRHCRRHLRPGERDHGRQPRRDRELCCRSAGAYPAGRLAFSRSARRSSTVIVVYRDERRVGGA